MKKQFLLLIVAISICCLLTCCNKDAGEDEEKQIENETAVSQQTPGLEIMERMTEEELKDKKNIYSPDYLIGKGSVEKGVYVSEHLSETRDFIGQLLEEVIKGYGEVPKEKESYFSDWALMQLKETVWEKLDENWEADFVTYGSSYSLNFLFGKVGYDFDYIFGNSDVTQSVSMQIYVDGNGIIQGIHTEIGSLSENTECTDCAKVPFCDKLQEIVVEEGIVYEGKILYEKSPQGVLVSGDAALDAEKMGRSIIADLEAGMAETGWKANVYFDCYCSDFAEETGDMSFTYYIYPDYEKMGVEAAKAVVFQCTADGELKEAEFQMYPMTKEEYQKAREWKGRMFAFIKNGDIVGGGDVPIPGRGRELIPAYTFTYEDILSDIADEIDRNTAGGWQIEEGYDFYYINYNEQSGRIHYRYYFYWKKENEENEKALIVDAWVSENGIEETQLQWSMTHRLLDDDTESDSEGPDSALGELDIDAFLEFDWTKDEVLLWEDHLVMPNDSAQGWDFSIADIDFDGVPEMLVLFTANHCGGNSAYIYKQEKGDVISYMDTYATPEGDMSHKIDYEAISPYMDIDLMDAYTNAKGQCRYLSLDCSSIGGDIKGAIYTISLYETVSGKKAMPKEIARIEYSGLEEKKELNFLGERVYEAGRLRGLIDEYMDGYTKVEIAYKDVEKGFARDLVAYPAEEREQELNELYAELRSFQYICYGGIFFAN